MVLKTSPGATAAPLTRGVGGYTFPPGGPGFSPADSHRHGTVGTHKGRPYPGWGMGSDRLSS